MHPNPQMPVHGTLGPRTWNRTHIHGGGWLTRQYSWCHLRKEHLALLAFFSPFACQTDDTAIQATRLVFGLHTFDLDTADHVMSSKSIGSWTCADQSDAAMPMIWLLCMSGLVHLSNLLILHVHYPNIHFHPFRQTTSSLVQTASVILESQASHEKSTSSSTDSEARCRGSCNFPYTHSANG